jgi:hypothetical protein
MARKETNFVNVVADIALDIGFRLLASTLA